MTDDVLVLLRQADPLTGPARYDEEAIKANLAQILASPDRPTPPPQRRTRARRRAGVAIAFVALIGAGTAAAAGWPGPQVRDAFDNPAVRQGLVQKYGSGADLAHARELVSIPGPDGSTVSTWTVPVAARGSCTAILVSEPSAPLPYSDGQRTLCGDTRPPGPVPLIDLIASPWRSPRTGIEYFNYSGQVGTATQIQIRIPGGPTYKAAVANGYFLLGSVPAAQLQCGTFERLDANGNQLEPPQYLTDACPADPATQISPPPQPSVDPATTVREPWATAYPYSNTVGVGINALVKQNPYRGAGSGNGMSLVTVQLQFFQGTGYPPAFPTSVSIDLLYGDAHSLAQADVGKHDDPDLSGVWTPPGGPSSGAFIPQRSFDVPTDQLGNLQVRLNGDATRPTVVFLDAQKALNP